MATTDTFNIQDPVYRGYIPRGTSIDIPERCERLSKEEFEGLLQGVIEQCFDARREEGQRQLDALPARLLDPARERLYLAGLQGDRYLAEEIILRDRHDRTTGQHLSSFPTITKTEAEKRTHIYTTLIALTSTVKEAMLRDNLSPLIASGRLDLQNWIPVTPSSSSASVAQRTTRTSKAPATRPIIYTLFLGDSKGVHPTGEEMRFILDEIRDYIHDIQKLPGSKRMGRLHRSNDADMQRLYDIESQTNSPTRNLTAAKVAAAKRNNIQHTSCKYVTTPADLDNIKRLIKVVENLLDESENLNVDMAEPLPWTLTVVGWTHDAAYRRYNYESHTGVSTHISIFGAVASTLFSGMQLRWRVLQEPVNSQVVEMSEHVCSVLDGSYISMSGLNIVAAGGSNSSSNQIQAGVYQSVLNHLTSRPHFQQNVNALVDQLSKERSSILKAKELEQAIRSWRMKEQKLLEARKKVEKYRPILEASEGKLRTAIEDFRRKVEHRVDALRFKKKTARDLSQMITRITTKVFELRISDVLFPHTSTSSTAGFTWKKLQGLTEPGSEANNRLADELAKRSEQYAVVSAGDDLEDCVIVDVKHVGSGEPSTIFIKPDIKQEVDEDAQTFTEVGDEDASADTGVKRYDYHWHDDGDDDANIELPRNDLFHTSDDEDSVRGSPRKTPEPPQSRQSPRQAPETPIREEQQQDQSPPRPLRRLVAVEVPPINQRPADQQHQQPDEQQQQQPDEQQQQQPDEQQQQQPDEQPDEQQQRPRAQTLVAVTIPSVTRQQRRALISTPVLVSSIMDVRRMRQSAFVVKALMTNGTTREFPWKDAMPGCHALLADWEWNETQAGRTPRKALPHNFRPPLGWRHP